MAEQTFGRYIVTKRLGRGGMAEVYQARDPVLDRRVAVKVIHPHLGVEEGFGERFRREARLVASLRHPYIVQLHDFGVADDQPFMVMEYLEGGTLKERLEQYRGGGGTMPLAEIVRLLQRMADALDYAHAQGAVHRDIKPTNILFTARGEPVLTDFGIVKILDETLQLSAAGSVLGSPAYMSPEQAASRVVDARSDLYSLGVVLYEMATGRVPFEGESPTAVMMKHLTEPPPLPRQFNPNLPQAVEAVILKALAKNLADRYSSAGELAAAFEEAVNGTPTMRVAAPAGEEATLVEPREEVAEVATLLGQPPGRRESSEAGAYALSTRLKRLFPSASRGRLWPAVALLVLVGLLFAGWQLLGLGGEEAEPVAGSSEPRAPVVAEPAQAALSPSATQASTRPTPAPSTAAPAVETDPSRAPVVAANEPGPHPDYVFVGAWGGQGEGSGQFNFPSGIAFGNGAVYVTDLYNARVQRFDPEGNYLGAWGSYGAEAGQFRQPADVAVAPDGSVYVVEIAGGRVQHFTAGGDYIEGWGSAGSEEGQFVGAVSIAVDSRGNVYVSDPDSHRIQKFDAHGALLQAWGSKGEGPGQFKTPRGVAVSEETVFVLDTELGRVLGFDVEGNFLGDWSGGREGFGDAFGLAVDSAGDVYVADTGNHRILKFDATGGLHMIWGSLGVGDGQFNRPYDVAVGPDGAVYIADGENFRVQKFVPADRLAEPYPPAGPLPAGVITYALPERRVFRIAPVEGATPEDVSAALDRLAPGSEDAWLNVSPDGEWLLVESNRFDPECADWPCLALVTGDLSAGGVVRSEGRVIHPEGIGAVSSFGADLIVYPSTGGPHGMDLWAVVRTGEGDAPPRDLYGAPMLLTADSPYAFNFQPAVSADMSRIVFECGNEPYSGEGTAICEVSPDGGGFRVVLTPADSPEGLPDTGVLRHPDYAPDGSIVFAASWDEMIWRLPPGETSPVRVTSQFHGDDSPCVLSDGQIATLWWGRPGGPGWPEIKVMAADGIDFAVIVTGMDLSPVSLGCR